MLPSSSILASLLLFSQLINGLPIEEAGLEKRQLGVPLIKALASGAAKAFAAGSKKVVSLAPKFKGGVSAGGVKAASNVESGAIKGGSKLTSDIKVPPVPAKVPGEIIAPPKAPAEIIPPATPNEANVLLPDAKSKVDIGKRLKEGALIGIGTLAVSSAVPFLAKGIPGGSVSTADPNTPVDTASTVAPINQQAVIPQEAALNQQTVSPQKVVLPQQDVSSQKVALSQQAALVPLVTNTPSILSNQQPIIDSSTQADSGIRSGLNSEANQLNSPNNQQGDPIDLLPVPVKSVENLGQDIKSNSQDSTFINQSTGSSLPGFGDQSINGVNKLPIDNQNHGSNARSNSKNSELFSSQSTIIGNDGTPGNPSAGDVSSDSNSA